MSGKKLSLTQKKLLDAITKQSLMMSQEIKKVSIATLIRLLRKRLHMTQRHLAARTGVPQSTIARLESGREKPKLQTVERVFAALFCDILLIPIPMIPFDEIIKKQARKVAEARLEYVKGTMSLEKQLPNSEMLDELISAEQLRLIQTASSEIWEV